MRHREPFQPDDLQELDEKILARADEVVAMREIAAGEHDPLVIGLRHDVDNIFEPCVELAEWEAARGYRATYFVLHDSPYWAEPGLREGLERIAALGHEIGIHVNAVAVALERGGDPHIHLEMALDRLRGWGHTVTGGAGHGDTLCHTCGFVNDEMFTDCARPEMGAPDRDLHYRDRTVTLEPRPLADHGLEYDTYRVGSRALYLSDSGGAWNEPFQGLADRFPSPFGQLHILVHPCWWTRAFAQVAV